MTSRNINSVEELHRILQEFAIGYIFRGVPEESHDLIPSVGRLGEATTAVSELPMFLEFKRRAMRFLVREPDNDWEWLAIARHHGVPTRLLDWTRNPLVALYFGIEKGFESDFALYATHGIPFMPWKPNDSPFEIDKVCMFEPRHVHLRFVAQFSVFTVHPKPWTPMEDEFVVKLAFSKNLKIPFRNMLEKYGVTRAALFPDLDGLAITLRDEYGYSALPDMTPELLQELIRPYTQPIV